RPNAALLDAPGLQPTPALAQAVFDYQKDVKQQREAAAKTAQAMASVPGAMSEEAKAADMKSDPAAKAMTPPDTMQPAMQNAAPAKEP
ncbi:hypothetical protein AB2R52_27475, partial [Klebsiella pneumoniae]|uniref:hypothetical protein n=1 Tax=Klebsiella pneumoniae TaxID=573 RepID=UPI00346191C9